MIPSFEELSQMRRSEVKAVLDRELLRYNGGLNTVGLRNLCESARWQIHHTALLHALLEPDAKNGALVEKIQAIFRPKHLVPVALRDAGGPLSTESATSKRRKARGVAKNTA